MDTQVSFGKLMMGRRQSLDITRDELADRVGCAPITIAKIERGERRPSRQMAELLADVLRLADSDRQMFIQAARGVPDIFSKQEEQAADTPDMPIEGNLPVSPNSFVGREDDVADILHLLSQNDVRLLTITGPAGIGKTRLSLQAVASMSGHYEHGVWFANLAPVRYPHDVVPALATILQVREAAGRPLLESLKDYLRNKEMLLVLDNFEQIIDASPLVSDLLASARRIKIVVTSREPLRLYGEHEYSVRPLQLPSAEQGLDVGSTEAVTLFVQRARSVKPQFALTEENAPAVAEICKRLDGLPLAIELAAARLRLFTPQAILARMEAHDASGSGGRLALLTGGARDLPARQQTLRNAISWSYDLLSEDERRLFRRLCVFNGGRSPEAVRSICQPDDTRSMDVIDGLESLVEKSLLRQSEGIDGEPRFWMLDTLREFARDMLHTEEGAAAADLYRHHALYFLQFAEGIEPQLRGREQVLYINRLAEEQSNLRAAFDWFLINGRSDEALRLSAALWRFWVVRAHWTEGRAQLAAALALQGGSEQARAKASRQDGQLAAKQGRYDEAMPLYKKAIATYRQTGNKDDLADSLTSMARTLINQSDYDAAGVVLEESLQLSNETGSRTGKADTMRAMATIAEHQGNYAEARSLNEQALVIMREQGDKLGIASLLIDLAWVAHRQGDYSRATHFSQEGIDLCKELGERDEYGACLNIMAMVAQEQGDMEKAASLLEEYYQLAEDLGSKPSMAVVLNNMGYLALSMGNYERAESLLSNSLALMNELGDTMRGISSRINLGTVALRRQDYAKAESWFSGALEQAFDLRAMRYIAECMEGLAEAITHSGRGVDAARLFGFASKMRSAIGEPLRSFEQPAYERAQELARSQIGTDAFASAWQEGRGMNIEEVKERWGKV